MKLPSGMLAAHDFSRAPQANIPRSSFNRSHGYKTTFNAGYLIPVLLDEALPGDTFNLKMTAFARLSTPIFPIMDNLWLDSFFFFVPNRLVWSHWANFNGEKANPSDSTTYVMPTITSTAVTGYTEGSIFDYFGLPVGIPSVTTTSLPLRCYNLIWNEWFRDENLQNSVTVSLGDGPDATTDFALLQRGKRHDYFTSCLPWPQKGTAVTLPIGGNVNCLTTGNPIRLTANTVGTSVLMYVGASGGAASTNLHMDGTGVSADQTVSFGATAGDSGLYVDLSSATAITINQMRQLFQFQRMYERDARGGTRYIEIVKSHFGVTAPDYRLQRPEYLGGGTTPVNINPVAQTSGTPASGTPQGNLAAFGTATVHGHGFTKSFVEHGYIIGLISVRADLSYQQGTNRMWYRSSRFDFYWPALSHLGEQPVYNREIYTQGDSNDTAVFGYQECYAEYRYKPSVITGLFRTSATGTLDSWHLAQNFGSLPTLNSTFIVENPPMSRIKAVTTEPDFLLDVFYNYKCARPMPVYGVPGLIDHF